jgi:DNA topoisomerase-3
MGYITYPRTETTKYASSYDFVKTLQDFSSHPHFGKQVTGVLKTFRKPTLRGIDVGDHPPITPSRVGNQGDLKGDHWELYEFICNNFFASIAEAAEYEETTYELDVNGNIFQCESAHITKLGFLTFMPWKAAKYTKDFPILSKEKPYKILRVASESHWTQPPSHLSESDLIKLMEHNKIGTDASMPVHIENICERGYVKVDGARRLIPTKLGKALIESLSSIDPEIVQPTIRSELENLVSQIAKGSKRYDEVLKYAIEVYKKKFLVIRQHYEKLLNSFKKYFEIDLLAMNQVYKTIKNKNEELKIKNQVKRE